MTKKTRISRQFGDEAEGRDGLQTGKGCKELKTREVIISTQSRGRPPLAV